LILRPASDDAQFILPVIANRFSPRAASAVVHIPQLGGARCCRGPKIKSRHHLAPQKASIPKLKYEALEISEDRGPFERKVLMCYSYFGPIWKQF